MKIRILDWTKFENDCHDTFTLDINNSDIQEVLGCFYFKGKHFGKNTLFYIVLLRIYDIVNEEYGCYEYIKKIKETDSFEIVDSTFNNVTFCKKKIVKVVCDKEEDLKPIKRTFTNIIAPKWIVDDPYFLDSLFYSTNISTEIYREHKKKEELEQKWPF